MDRQIIKKIVDAAVQAPSGDNVQPWRFEIAKDFSCLKLYNLPELDDSYYNYQQAASYVAHGAVIENIVIAARHLGCKAEVELFPAQDDPSHVANVSFQLAEAEFDPLYEAIFSRSTNRFHFHNGQLPDLDRQNLSAVIEAVDGVSGYFVYDSKIISQLAKVLMVNDRLVFERQDIHRFLFDKIRWNQQQIEQTKDGMPVDTLGLSGFEKLFFPFMRFWGFVRFANYFGLSRVIGIKCWYNCKNAALIGLLTVKKSDRYGLVVAGRAMQRVWLEATHQGLAFQPIIGLPLLMLRAKANALGEFSERHIQMVVEAENALRSLFKIDRSEELVVGFRVGKGRKVAAKTLRKPGFD